MYDSSMCSSSRAGKLMKRDETALMRQQRRVQEFLMTRVGTEADRFFIIETQEAQLFQLANEISVCVCV